MKKFVLVSLFLALFGCNSCFAPPGIGIQSNVHSYLDSDQHVDHLHNSTVALGEFRESAALTGEHWRTFCSAFAVSRRFIVTANHCMQQTSVIEVAPGFGLEISRQAPLHTQFKFINYNQWSLLSARQTEPVPHVAELVAFDEENDVAVLQLSSNESDFTDWFTMYDETLRVGEPTVACGNPVGIGFNVTEGRVSQIYRDEHGSPTDIITTTPIYFGSSGGVLVDSQGRAIGIADFVVGRQAVLNGFKPIRYAEALLNRLNH